MKYSVKKTAVIIVAALAVLVGGGIAISATVNYNSPAKKLSRTLSSAESRISAQDYAGAAAEYQKALELDLANAEIYLDLADSYIALGDTGKAIETLQKGSEATGDQAVGDKLNELLVNRAIDTARQCLDGNDHEAALEQFKFALELDSSRADAYLGSSDALTNLDKIDEALEILQTGFEITKDGKLDEKRKELAAARSLKLAEQYILDKDYSSAKTEFENVLAADDKNAAAYIGIAEAFAGLGDTENAVKSLQLGLDKTGDEKIRKKLDDLNISMYLEAAQKYYSERKFDLAKNENEKVLAIDDKCVDAYIGAADSYIGMGNSDKAINVLQRGTEKTRDDKLSDKLGKLTIADLSKKGKTCLNEKKYDEAITNFKKVLETDKKNVSAYIGIAEAYIALGNSDEAISVLGVGFNETKNKMLEEKLDSVKASAALTLARQHLDNGKYADAVSEFNKALESDEKCVEAYTGLADAYTGLNDTDNVLNVLQDGYDKTGDGNILSRLNGLRFDISLELARTYLSQGDYAKARDEFQNVLNLDGSCVEAYLGKADAYIGLGDITGANDVLRTGWNATWDSRIQNRMSRGKLNNLPLNPRKCGYEPLNTLVEQILDSITTADMDTYDKVKACYDYLIETCVYGQGDGIYDVLSLEDMFNNKSLYEKFAYIILRDHEGVCDYYSAAFAALTRAIGLDTKIRGGQTSTARTESGYTGHAWCVIIIDGIEYVFDPQVEDNIAKGGTINYYRFCKSYDEVKNNYIPSFWVDM